MKDLAIRLENRPGALAKMGETLALAGLSIEGGGAWLMNDVGIAHFLLEDATKAREVLKDAGIEVLQENPVLIQKLKQDQPGQLGKITRLMAEAGVNLEVQYSDHNKQLILVVDDYEKGKIVSENWTQGKYE